jgi:hypothetical protein
MLQRYCPDGEGAKTSEKELFEFRIKLSHIDNSEFIYIKPYFGLILSLLGTVLSSAALDARCGASMAVQDLDACRRCCYGYRCLLLQPKLCVRK